MASHSKQNNLCFRLDIGKATFQAAKSSVDKGRITDTDVGYPHDQRASHLC